MSAVPAPLNRLRKEWREGRPTFGRDRDQAIRFLLLRRPLRC
jgi:hypothetical protein